ncbi:MAG: hypothetical protein NTY42_03525 [Planctomycetota bacterium]|nr:hypothetical protein [Planctomycetota bacterium]
MARQAAKTQSLPPIGHDKTLWIDRIESDQTLVERLQLNSCLLCALATLRAIKRPEFLDSVIEEISNQNVRTVLPDLELHLSLGERGWLAKPPRRKVYRR